jgi:hypothetical protein
VRIKNLIICSFLTATLSVAASAQNLEELRRTFAAPPADARIMMRWWWFGPSVTKAEIERELRTMKEGGIGGVEVQPVYPLLPDDPVTGHKNLPYLSDEFLEMLRFASEKAKELGMRFDLTLGSGWSFGGARTPITEAAGQLRVERVKIDQGATSVPTPSLIPSEKLMAVFAQGVDGRFQELSTFKDGRGTLPANAAGEVVFFISGKSGMQVKRPSFGAEGYVLNHLDKPSVDSYLHNTGDRLFEAFKGSEVPYSVFCDSLEVYNQDWTGDFLAEFQKRRGYDLKPLLPALIADIGPDTADIRYDWGRTITELFNERFMIPMQEWSKRNGTRFRIQGYGIPPAAISSNKWADISDGEGAQWKVVRAARWASSANHVYGRKVTSSETWTWLNSPVFRATPLDLKAEADIHFLQGINQLIGHGWGYTPPGVEYPGWRFYAAGAYSEQNPWWIVMPDLAAYLQRLSYLLRQGQPANDVALYLPNADAYARFSPGKVHLIDMERELVGDKLMPAIFAAGYNLDFFDDEMLQTLGRFDNGQFVIGSSRHRAVVLPSIERMPIATLRALDKFARAGGVVLSVGSPPSKIAGKNVSSAERTEFAEIARRMYSGEFKTVRAVKSTDELAGAIKEFVKPDLEIDSNSTDFGFVHRRLENSDVYFIANTSNQKRTVQLTFRAPAQGIEIWDPLAGNANVIVPTSTDGAIKIAASFEPYESHVYVLSKGGEKLPQKVDHTSTGNTIDLNSDWIVRLAGGVSKKLAKLRSWSADEDTKYFSGVGEYEKRFNVGAGFFRGDSRFEIDFGEGTPLEVATTRNGMRTWYDPPVRESAVVYLNGSRVGSLWAPPYRLDVTKFLRAGENELKIQVGNTALNYMAGRRLPDYRLLNLRYGERFQAQDMDKIAPLPSGILGTVRIVERGERR